MTPEEKAREQIDTMLKASGWVVQTKDKINLSAARGVAVPAILQSSPGFDLTGDAAFKGES